MEGIRILHDSGKVANAVQNITGLSCDVVTHRIRNPDANTVARLQCLLKLMEQGVLSCLDIVVHSRQVDEIVYKTVFYTGPKTLCDMVYRGYCTESSVADEGGLSIQRITRNASQLLFLVSEVHCLGQTLDNMTLFSFAVEPTEELTLIPFCAGNCHESLETGTAGDTSVASHNSTSSPFSANEKNARPDLPDDAMEATLRTETGHGGSARAVRWNYAPELLLGRQREAAQADGVGRTVADLWALGCLIAEMCLGEPLFSSGSTAEHIRKIMVLLGPPSRAEMTYLTDEEYSDLLIAGKAVLPGAGKHGPAGTGGSFGQLFSFLPPSMSEILRALLSWAPATRPSARDALAKLKTLEGFKAATQRWPGLTPEQPELSPIPLNSTAASIAAGASPAAAADAISPGMGAAESLSKHHDSGLAAADVGSAAKSFGPGLVSPPEPTSLRGPSLTPPSGSRPLGYGGTIRKCPDMEANVDCHSKAGAERSVGDKSHHASVSSQHRTELPRRSGLLHSSDHSSRSFTTPIAHNESLGPRYHSHNRTLSAKPASPLSLHPASPTGAFSLQFRETTTSSSSLGGDGRKSPAYPSEMTQVLRSLDDSLRSLRQRVGQQKEEISAQLQELDKHGDSKSQSASHKPVRDSGRRSGSSKPNSPASNKQSAEPPSRKGTPKSARSRKAKKSWRSRRRTKPAKMETAPEVVLSQTVTTIRGDLPHFVTSSPPRDDSVLADSVIEVDSKKQVFAAESRNASVSVSAGDTGGGQVSGPAASLREAEHTPNRPAAEQKVSSTVATQTPEVGDKKKASPGNSFVASDVESEPEEQGSGPLPFTPEESSIEENGAALEELPVETVDYALAAASSAGPSSHQAFSGATATTGATPTSGAAAITLMPKAEPSAGGPRGRPAFRFGDPLLVRSLRVANLHPLLLEQALLAARQGGAAAKVQPAVQLVYHSRVGTSRGQRSSHAGRSGARSRVFEIASGEFARAIESQVRIDVRGQLALRAAREDVQLELVVELLFAAVAVSAEAGASQDVEGTGGAPKTAAAGESGVKQDAIVSGGVAVIDLSPLRYLPVIEGWYSFAAPAVPEVASDVEAAPKRGSVASSGGQLFLRIEILDRAASRLSSSVKRAATLAEEDPEDDRTGVCAELEGIRKGVRDLMEML